MKDGVWSMFLEAGEYLATIIDHSSIKSKDLLVLEKRLEQIQGVAKK